MTQWQVVVGAVKFDNQERPRITHDEIPHAVKGRILTRVVQNELVHYLDGDGVMFENDRHCRQRLQEIGKVNCQHCLGLRQWNQFDFRFNDDS